MQLHANDGVLSGQYLNGASEPAGWHNLTGYYSPNNHDDQLRTCGWSVYWGASYYSTTIWSGHLLPDGTLTGV